MPEHPHFEEETVVNPETHHEKSDVNVRALLVFVAIFIVFAAVVHVALWLLFKFYVQIGKHGQTPALTSVSRPANADVPATPRLQPFPTEQSTKTPGLMRSPVADTPVADLDQMRAHEEQVLNNAGWVDQQHGVVHIPIEQAKQLALQRNLYPVNTATAAPPPAASPNGPSTAGAPRTPPAAATQGEPNAARVGSTKPTGTPQQ